MTEEPQASKRLDVYVSSLYPDKSRGFAAKLIEQGRVEVNGAAQTKTGYRLKDSDKVTVDYDQAAATAIRADIDLKVLYEDDDCVVIEKPTGVLTHSKGEFNPEATVATWLAPRLKDMSGERAGIVHRLDRATSGVMICAKTPAALSWLQKQFAQRKVKKTYEAVVLGHLKQQEAVIDMPIERNPKRPQTFRVGSNGKSAVTAYKVIESGENYSLLELMPTTGRTHQLRVHLAQLGHPILGDNFYGAPDAERLFLHAKSLELTLPDKQRMTFSVPTPDIFSQKVRS